MNLETKRKKVSQPLYRCQCPYISDKSEDGCGDETYGYMLYPASELFWWPKEYETCTGIPAGWYIWGECVTEQFRWDFKLEDWENLAEHLGFPRWKAGFFDFSEEKFNKCYGCTVEKWRSPEGMQDEYEGDADTWDFIEYVISDLHTLSWWLEGKAIFSANAPFASYHCENSDEMCYPADELFWWNGKKGGFNMEKDLFAPGWYSISWLESDEWYWRLRDEEGWSDDRYQDFEKFLSQIPFVEGALDLSTFLEAECTRERKENSQNFLQKIKG